MYVITKLATVIPVMLSCARVMCCWTHITLDIEIETRTHSLSTRVFDGRSEQGEAGRVAPLVHNSTWPK